MYNRRLDLEDLLRENMPDQLLAVEEKNQRMRLKALSRWEGEGGALSPPD